MNSSIRQPAVLLLGLIILIAVAAIAVNLLARGDESNIARVERGTLDVTIETSGRLVTRDPAIVRSGAGGRVETVGVQLGDAVEPGDVIVSLEREPFEQAIRQAEDQLENAEVALNLAEQESAEDPTPAQIAQRLAAEQHVRDAERALEQAEERLSSSLVLARAEGTVIDLQAASGAPVAEGAIVAQVADLTDLELNVDIDEIDLPRIDIGAGVTITLDAYPGQEIEGTLTRVSPVAQTTGGTTTFPSTISMSLPGDMVVRPGMNANVTIQTAVRENVLLVPERALRTVGQRTFVMVVKNGTTEEREIQVGLRSRGQVEVGSGLNEGDQVQLR